MMGDLYPPFYLLNMNGILSQINLEKVPRHIAIIMDGNGRWAQSRNLDRTHGHREGVKRVEEIVDIAHKIGVKVLTLYTFSTENWNRPAAEINILMNILLTVISRKIQKLKDDNIRFYTIGRREPIPQSVLNAMDKLKEETKNNTGIVLNLAFNYGSRLEIVDAVRQISQDVLDQKIKPEDISEATISQVLNTKEFPDPDLLIRTSGEKRISNFLLWQLSYSELAFVEKYWPDFTEEEFLKTILDYQNRKRRFGSLANQ